MIEKNFCKIFEITRTIYSNSESSEQFLGLRNMQEKLEKKEIVKIDDNYVNCLWGENS